MRLIPVSVLFLFLLFMSTFYASALFAADSVSAGSSSGTTTNSSTSAPAAPRAPSATPAARAPGATKYINNNQTDSSADSSIEDECKKPRNPGDPSKDDKCFERRTVD